MSNPASKPESNVPRQLGDYELLDRIGGGQTGPVFQARNRTSGRMFAIKVLPPELAGQKTILKRFEREAALALKLNHASLTAAFDSGHQDGVAYLVTEYFTGKDLATIIKERGPLDVEQARDFFLQAAEGLAYLHAQGVVHRNVKPHNLLLGGHGNVKIANLLLAQLEDGSILHDDGVSIENLTRTGQMIGSVDYLSPEQARDSSRVDAKTDIYALGCTLHYLLLGKPPFQNKAPMQTIMAHATAPAPSLRAARPEVPEDLDELFQQMLAKKPEDRPRSMQACITALRGSDFAPRLAKWLIPLVAVIVLITLAYLLTR